MAQTPTTVIGLDGASFTWLQPFMDGGVMPALAGLQQRGVCAPLASTTPPFTASAWSSLITGQNPGGHGVLSFQTRDRFNYDTSGSGFTNASRFTHTLWEIISQHERRVCILNVPMTYPPIPVNGVMVTGMLTPPGGRFTYPPEVADSLGPGYRIDVNFLKEGERFKLSGMPPKKEMLREIRQVTQAHLDGCARLLATQSFDFFMVVFTGTDRLSHFFWDDLTQLLANNLQPASKIQEDILDYCRQLDEGIARLLERRGEEQNVFVLSDHGFGPAPNRRFYVNIWLEHAGLLKLPEPDQGVDLQHWRYKLARIRWLKALLRRLLPQRAQDSVTSATTRSNSQPCDWTRTKAYFVPIYFHVCGIELNVAGRQRDGFIQPGSAEYETLRDQIIQDALRLVDPQTGQPFVSEARRREALYSGPYVETFPDIILVLDPLYIGAGSLAGSQLVEPHPDPMRPGEHREAGVFMAAGPDIQAGNQIEDLALLDIPPTLLHALGLPIPGYFDGRSCQELFTADFRKANPLQIQEMDRPALVQESDAPLERQQEQELEDRLRGLGYLD